MDFGTKISSILKANPDGLRASEIAIEIGCERKFVNSFLYTHRDEYERSENYIWTLKNKNSRLSQSVCESKGSREVVIQQQVGTNVVSVLTIFPLNEGFNVASTNNQIVCCDCNMFFSIHAKACPFCGCPLHYIADNYYKKYSKIIFEKRTQTNQQTIQQNQIQIQTRSKQKETQEKEDLIREIKMCSNYRMGNDIDVEYVSLEQLKKMYDEALDRKNLIKKIHKGARAYLKQQAVEVDILSTKMLEVVAERCSGFSQEETLEKRVIEKKAEEEFKKAVIEEIFCSAKDLERLYDLFDKYARGYRQVKKWYSINIKDYTDVDKHLEINFFEKLYVSFRYKAQIARNEAYEKGPSYQVDSDRILDEEKAEQFLALKYLVDRNISVKSIEEIVAKKLLSDLDVKDDLIYRVAVITHNDIIVETDNLKDVRPAERVFLQVVVCESSGEKVDRRIIGVYNENSGKYYISEYDFLKLVLLGKVEATMISLECKDGGYNDDGFAVLSPESLLRKCGYNVNSNENLTEKKRHEILKAVIENKLYAPSGIISHLSFLVAMNKKVESRDMSYAIKKWVKDIEYIKKNF